VIEEKNEKKRGVSRARTIGARLHIFAVVYLLVTFGNGVGSDEIFL